MSGKLICKIRQRTDYIKKDGTSALYIQIYLEKQKAKIPLNISVKPKDFDKDKQIVKGKNQLAKDYNLLIGQKLGIINKIAVSYRLSGVYLTLDKLLEDLNNPTAKIDFIKFWEKEMEKQKEILDASTYRQQYSTLTKIKKFKEKILFNEINEDFLNELIAYCKNKLNNKETTIQTTLKNFKKYLHKANKKGIRTELNFQDIKVKSFQGDRTFLNSQEIKRLFKYYKSEFISETKKNILSRFLFSCFTGLRISDILRLKPENIIGDYIAFQAKKSGKFQKIKLNDSAKLFIDPEYVFKGEYSEPKINEYLKSIASSCNIKKHITFHVSRHTFATNYLLSGGKVENLQEKLGHSNIRETMLYVHIVRAISDKEIDKMDNILDVKLQ